MTRFIFIVIFSCRSARRIHRWHAESGRQLIEELIGWWRLCAEALARPTLYIDQRIKVCSGSASRGGFREDIDDGLELGHGEGRQEACWREDDDSAEAYGRGEL